MQDGTAFSLGLVPGTLVGPEDTAKLWGLRGNISTRPRSGQYEKLNPLQGSLFMHIYDRQKKAMNHMRQV